MKMHFVFLLFVTSAIIFFFILPHAAYAADTSYDLNPRLAHESTVVCSSLGGFWFNGTSTCSLSSDLSLDSGDLIRVDAGASLNITGVKLTVPSGSRITNFGIINIGGEIYNYGDIDNFETGRINSGIGIVYDFVSIANWGAINNSGGVIMNSLTIWSWRTIENSGTIFNEGGKIMNVGRIVTSGSIDNKGNINNGGRIDNYGAIFNFHGSRIYNTDIGIIASYNESNIVNNGGTVLNMGSVEIHGALYNIGTINIYGQIINDGRVINNSSGTIINHNSGVINNKGAIDNYGNITTVYGKLVNSDTIRNGCGGFVNGMISENPVTNTCTSTTTTTITSITTVTSTTSIEQIVDYLPYAWAVGATVTSFVFAVVLLLQRRTK